MRTVFGALMIATMVAGCGNDSGDAATRALRSETATDDALGAAVQISQASMPIELIDEIVADYIDELCRAATTGETSGLVTEAAEFPVDSETERREVLDAMADGAESYCPQDLTQRTDLIAAIATGADAADAAAGDSQSPASTLSETVELPLG